MRTLLALVISAAALVSGCGGSDSTATDGRVFVLRGNGGQSEPHPSGVGAGVVVPVGTSFEIHTDTPVRWRVEYPGGTSSGFGNTLNFSGLTVAERTTSNPTTTWSASLAGTVQSGQRVIFQVVAETTPETEFRINVTQ